MTNQKLTIFAASSLTDALPQVAAVWQRSKESKVTFSFDSSSRLAKQIEEGAPADIYFSAHPIWMDYLEKKNLIHNSSREELLSNRLVLAVPRQNQGAFSWDKLTKVALAGESVPAGIYGKTALKNEGRWRGLQNKVIRGTNVRTVLGWLDLAAIPAGIVYQSDTVSQQSKIAIAHVFAESSHPPIVYPMAVVNNSKAKKLAKEFLEFCRSHKALDIFKSAGFKLVD